MKKILYVMHISWGWIKQRPQFIAEELAKYYEVDVFYRMSNHNKEGENPSLKIGNLNVRGFRNWPFERLKFIPVTFSYYVNKWIWMAKQVDVSCYDYIWVTDPVLWWALKDTINNKKTKLIYDCMDDYSAFPYMERYAEYKIFSENMEKELLKSADFVFCSANSLKEKLLERYGIRRQYNIINNAITQDISTYEPDLENIELPRNSLVYIGTISEWFDFENVLKALDEFPELHVVLYGPKRMEVIPSHKRLEFRGPTSHCNILTIMNKASGLLMPFILNDLIQSVNPVKLYEYIYSGKPILVTKYGESQPFADYVSLYENYSEFKKFIQENIMTENSLDKDRMQSYALNNTWEARTKQIIKLIDGK